MAYYLDLFSPETYKAFTQSPPDISVFRPRQRNAARRVKVGDKLIVILKKEKERHAYQLPSSGS